MHMHMGKTAGYFKNLPPVDLNRKKTKVIVLISGNIFFDLK